MACGLGFGSLHRLLSVFLLQFLIVLYYLPVLLLGLFQHQNAQVGKEFVCNTHWKFEFVQRTYCFLKAYHKSQAVPADSRCGLLRAFVCIAPELFGAFSSAGPLCTHNTVPFVCSKSSLKLEHCLVQYLVVAHKG